MEKLLFPQRAPRAMEGIATPLGDPFEVLAFAPITVLKCRCVDGGTVLQLTTINQAVPCPRCKRMYFIEELHYARKSHSMAMTIGHDPSLMGDIKDA